MSKHLPRTKFLIIFLVSLVGTTAYLTFAKAQEDSLDDRMARKITLDARDMNIEDTIKFLAQKGEFNVIISPSVEGRSTVFLRAVSIKDALDIVVISNKLAYHIDDDIVQVMTAGEYEDMYGQQFSDKTEVIRIKKTIEQIERQLGAMEKPIRSPDVPAKEVLIKARVSKIVIDSTHDVGRGAPVTGGGSQQLGLSGNPLVETVFNAAAAMDNWTKNFGRIVAAWFLMFLPSTHNYP